MQIFNFKDEEKKINSIIHFKTEIKPLDSIPSDESQLHMKMAYELG